MVTLSNITKSEYLKKIAEIKRQHEAGVVWAVSKFSHDINKK